MRPPQAIVLGAPDAPWLVACHGMALDHRDLLPFASLAAERGWRVLLWDMPGHGGSAPPAEWSLAAMTDGLEALLEANGVVRPVLLGFSFGGMVAQGWMRRHPGGAAALVAYGCYAPFSQPPPVPRPLARALTISLWGPLSWPAIQARFARLCAASDEGRREVGEAMRPLGKPGFLAMATALLRGFEPDPAFRVDCPLLLLRGREDSNAALLDRAEAALLVQRPDATVSRVEQAGHCAHLDRPQAFAAAVLSFLGGLGLVVTPDGRG